MARLSVLKFETRTTIFEICYETKDADKHAIEIKLLSNGAQLKTCVPIGILIWDGLALFYKAALNIPIESEQFY